MENRKVKIMGILNVTPDSFSDGGKYMDPDLAVARARQIVEEGADMIDIGGESSGPGSVDVPLEEELRRVIPLVRAIRKVAFISVDTYKAEVARQAIAAGARMINDVTGLRGDPEMVRVIAATGAPVVLMYSKDPTARTTRLKKHYRDVVKIIYKFLEERIDFVLRNGVKPNQIIIDPGMGAFVSMDPKYSFEILERLAEFKKLGFPILVGVSRKSFLQAEPKRGYFINAPRRAQPQGKIEERLESTLAANRLAIQNGADIIRVHDVPAHRSMAQK
jgi:dihydropteroate synthase